MWGVGWGDVGCGVVGVGWGGGGGGGRVGWSAASGVCKRQVVRQDWARARARPGPPRRLVRGCVSGLVSGLV